MKTAQLKVIRPPEASVSVIAWDGQTIVSSLIAGLAGEALNKPVNREYFLKYLDEATQTDAMEHTVHSGNGLNLLAVSGLCFLDHDYFADKKAVLSQGDVLGIIKWIEVLEVMGFPGADIDYPGHAFSYVSDGPAAEAEFRLATGFRGSTASG